MRHLRWILPQCVVFLVFIGQSEAQGPVSWVEDSFGEFADGQLDASGQNLYVARDGTIRTINRFDLNQDGFLDLIFNSTHDTSYYVPATVASLTSDQKIQQGTLAVRGSLQVLVADLNRDGHSDLAFCPNDSGLQTQRRFLTIIWGGEDGWPSHRSNGLLPVHGAMALVAADFNRDQWPDLVVLNSEAWLPQQPQGQIVRIFWGSKRGYLLNRRQDLGVPKAFGLAASDFDRDGGDDVAVLTSGGSIRLLWSTSSEETPKTLESSDIQLPGTEATCLTTADWNRDGHADLLVGTSRDRVYVVSGRSGRSWSDTESQAGFKASHLTVGDLDGDENPDLVLSYLSLTRAGGGEVAGAGKDADGLVRILWGHTSGFSQEQSTTLKVAQAAAAGIGDLNGDGLQDLSVAVFQGKESFRSESRILLGRGDRKFHQLPQGVQTVGAAHVAVVPPEGSFPARIVFSNRRGGAVDEKVPLHVYWGTAGGFEVDRRWDIPFRSGYEASAADLNADGFVDLIALNSGHGGQAARSDPSLGANIFWGAESGFDLDQRRTVLSEKHLGSSNVADLNRDGYLDLVLGAFESYCSEDPVHLLIYYGSAEGLDRSRRVAVLSEGRSTGCAIADFNRDEWLDIAVTSTLLDRVRVFWGAPGGFSEARQSQLDIPYPIGLETADFNADGYLDLIAGSYYDRMAKHHDTGSLIFWGGSSGFRPWNAQWLPGPTPIGPAVADFDSDGYLDVFNPHYLADLTREQLPCYLYWGGPEGFSPSNRTNLVCDSGHDAMAADFDQDGRIDLAVSCHTQNGDHYTDSKVFYNDGKRFAEPRIDLLPTHGPHWMWAQDVGHIYHRKWEQTYRSSIFNWDRSLGSGRLNFKAEVPTGARVSFSVRSAASEAGIERAQWRQIQTAPFELQSQDRYLQYELKFYSKNGDAYPVLDQVSIALW